MPERLMPVLRAFLKEKNIVISEKDLADASRRAAYFVLAYVTPHEAKPPMENRNVGDMSKIQRFVFGAEQLEATNESEFLGHQTNDVYFLFSNRLVNVNERRVTYIDAGKTHQLLSTLCTKRPDPTYDFEEIRKMVPRSVKDAASHPFFGISVEKSSARVWCMSAPAQDDSYAMWLPTRAMVILRTLFQGEACIRGTKRGAIFYTRWVAAYVKSV